MSVQIITAKGYDELSRMAATLIGGQILSNPHCVLGLATGGTPEGMYARLVEMHREGLLDFSGVTTFNLDEYCGLCPEDPQSYLAYMERHLFGHVNVNRDAVHLPDGSAADLEGECAVYEEKIRRAGGVDLQLLGIGNNGHIGFNEPDTAFSACTQVVTLAESTIQANARYYDSPDQVPATALSMGIGTIFAARSILLLASGEGKKEIVKRALFGPVSPQVPASILQFHPHVTVLVDFPL